MTPVTQAAVRLQLADAGMVLVAQEKARQVGRAAGLSTEDAESAAVIAAELASNAQRHAQGGQLLLQPVAGACALDLVALDRGPGLADLASCFRDGFTTAGSLGAGLGAVQRRASSVGGCSEPGRGTVVWARVGPGCPPAAVGAFGSPARGERVNGDAWAWTATRSGLFLVLADGLGHGPAAATASTRAVEDIADLSTREPADAVELVHRRLRGTRGAAVTVALLRPASGDQPAELVVAGVGNVAAAVIRVDGQVRRSLIGHGTAGLAVRRPPQTTTAIEDGGVVVLHTDGLTSAWNLLGRTEVLRSPPAVLAGVLLRDYERGNDDTGIVVARAEPTAEGAGA